MSATTALRAWDVYFIFQNIREIVQANFSLTSLRRDRSAYIMLSFSHGAPQLSYDLSPPELAEPRIMVATSVCRTDVEYDLTFTFRPTWAEQPRFRSLTEGTLGPCSAVLLPSQEADMYNFRQTCGLLLPPPHA